MSEKFRFPVEGDADRVMDRMPFSDSPEGIKEILKPSEEQELAQLMEEQAVDQATGFGDIMESAGSAVGKLAKKAGRVNPVLNYFLNTGTAGEGSHIVPDLTDINDPTRQNNLRIWGRGENTNKAFSLLTDSLDNPVVFFHSSPNFIGRSFDPRSSFQSNAASLSTFRFHLIY